MKVAAFILGAAAGVALVMVVQRNNDRCAVCGVPTYRTCDNGHAMRELTPHP